MLPRYLGSVAGWFILTSLALGAPEPWADKRLPEKNTEGLVLWLDAAGQSAARQALNKAAVADQGPLDVWYDASGHGRHMTQPLRDAQPKLHVLTKGAAVRFDGQDDFLSLAGLKLEPKAATVFVAVAPLTNAGGFRGFVAASSLGKNDYHSGFTLDLGPFGSGAWQTVNVEGVGFGGFQNLLTKPLDFGTFHRLTAVFGDGPDGVRLFADGKAAGKRQRTPGPLGLDQVFVGARTYSNEARPPFVQGFFDGAVAEVMIYDRVLKDEERQEVEKYLAEKYAGVTLTVTGKRLVTVKDPPPVQVLLPGFAVRHIPLDLPNLNNIRYRADGKLVALAYNGDVYVLSDTDADGLADKAEQFWDNKGRVTAPIGVALTPPGYKHGEGLFVACKGKVVLIADTDGDGKADKETVVASGWKELPHGVDALGVALDRDGNVYFGLGTTDFTNAYQIDKTGKAQYDLKSERGTIMRVSPDFSKREVVATGIRFPVGMAFNRDGDLFATDQEGATWLPNGNPLDELLHVQAGRHYGFPPRHPKHLPGVIDEPSVFDYGPQHQSLCGLVFNDRVKDGRIFGADWWEGDALVSGYSRGKLYRTELVKTPHGYVARNHLIACLNMLTVDSCVSPNGDLVVAVHSGDPDWGSGPTGKGKLYQIRYEPQTPQPVAAWASGPGEVRVAFDRPLDDRSLAALTKLAKVEYGAHVRPGDRFEVVRPGYAVVQQQLSAPRSELAVLGTAVTQDRRTLIVSTRVHPQATAYALTLGDAGRVETPAPRLPQYGGVELGYELTGVDVKWEPASGKGAWSGWLPHLDLAVSRAMTRGSAEHDALWQSLKQPGRLTLKSKVNLWQLLRPAVQPGSTIDYTWPAEKAAVEFQSPSAIQVKAAGGTVSAADQKVRWEVEPKEGEPALVEVGLDVPEAGPTLDVTFSTNEDTRPRALPLGRFLLPWATLKPQATAQRVIPELEGGSRTRGRAVFFGDAAGCGKCHTVRGVGGKAGPDLSNLVHRDYDSVMRDIRTPSAALNPDFLSSVVEMKSGQVHTGLVRPSGTNLVITDNNGRETTVRQEDVDEVRPSSMSLMPEGIEKVLDKQQMRDLLTFLLTESLSPSPLEIPGAPPPRSRAEVEAALKGSETPKSPPRKLTVVLSSGPKDHGPGEHDYPLWQRRWVKLFDLADEVTVVPADGWPTAAMWEKADLVVFYSNNPGWSAEKANELDAYLARGGGLAFIHYAVDGHKDADVFAERIGLAWQGGRSKFRHGPLELDFGGSKHPIARNFGKLKLIDESYWNLVGDAKSVDVLASGVEDNQPQPLLWAKERGKGRVFVSIPGHYTWTFDDPLFRLLLLRGMAWAAGESVDRFNGLVGEGVRWAD